MIQLKNKQSGEVLGSISEEDLQFLVDNLEEEWKEDTDYYLNRATLEMLKGRAAPEGLMGLLERAMAGSQDIEIEWSRA
jgi:hypothetical protein